MPAATLALGQSSYELLDVLTDPGNGTTGVAVSKRSIGIGSNYVTDIRSTLRDGLLSDLGIGLGALSQTSSNVNVFSRSQGLQADFGAGGDTLNLFADALQASIELDDSGARGVMPTGGGNDLLNAQRNFSGSVFAGDGNDTVRIAGNVDNSLFSLGAGNDLLSIGGTAQNVGVFGDAGNDLLQFRGLATDAIVQGGEGSDTVQFFSGLTGTNARTGPGIYEGPTASVDLGAGNDSLLIGGNGLYSNLEIATGTGFDTVSLAGDFIDTGITLGSGAFGDSLNLSSGSLNQSWISSSSTVGDSLVFGGATSLYNTNPNTGIFLGSGGDSVVFGGYVQSTVNTGLGSDTVVFGANSAVSGTNLNLGGDAVQDQVFFNMSLADVRANFSTGMRITGQTTADTLYIGYGDYQAYAWNQTGNYWFGSGGDRDTVRFIG